MTMPTTTKVIRCTCISKWQDARYGLNKRLANRCNPKSDFSSFRCTVCKATH